MAIETRRGDWMQTFTGRAFYPMDPRPEDIDILDIGHHLGMICRYGGAVSKFYSVAEHSVLLAKYVLEKKPGDTQLALQALLHDAAEAYICDIPRPLKRCAGMAGYAEIEMAVEEAIQAHFGLQYPGKGPDLFLHDIDERIMVDEAQALLTRITNHWHQRLGAPLGVDVIGLSPADARGEFWLMYDRLTSAAS